MTPWEQAIEREQKAAIAAGLPWPPRRPAQAGTTHGEAAAVIARLPRDGYGPQPGPDPGGSLPLDRRRRTRKHPHRSTKPDGRSGRLDALPRYSALMAW